MGGGDILALDLGGTRLKAALVAAGSGDVSAFTTVPVAGADADEALETLVATGRDVLAGRTAMAVGLSVPGTVEDQRITSLPGKFPGIEGRDLGGLLRERFGAPAVVINDAVAYAVGEAAVGAGAGRQRVLVVTIGTGVGVCMIEDGLPLGSGPYAGGTIGGHIPISDDSDGPVDTNGRRGTIEARCFARALVTYAHEAGAQVDDVPALYAAHAAGDPAAVAAVDTYRRWLVRGLVALAHAHTPEVIVLGGGPMVPGNPVTVGLRDAVSERTWPGYTPDVRVAALGDQASLAGLARLCVRGVPA